MWYPGSDCGGFLAFCEWMIALCMLVEASIAVWFLIELGRHW